jgi:hypothetical protein
MSRKIIPALLLVGVVATGCSENSADPTGAEFEVTADALNQSPEIRQSPALNGFSPDAMVYVVHGVNGTDLGLAEMLPVDVEVSGACVLEGFEFREIAGPLALPEGSYDIKVKLADETTPCSGGVAIDAPGVAVTAGLNASIVAHLDADGVPTAAVFVNDVSRSPGYARIAAHHTADFGAVDILVDGAVAFPGVMNGQQGVAPLRPRTYEVAIAIAGTSTRAFEADLMLNPFNLYNAYAVGTPENETFEVILQQIPITRSNRWSR